MITLIPAHGRDYKSKLRVLEDYLDGKEFKFANIGLHGGIGTGMLCSIKDFENIAVKIRFNKNRDVIIFHPNRRFDHE